MSRASDIKLAKWLIKQDYAEKEIVEKWLNAKFKAEKAGKKVPSFLNLLLKKGVLDSEQVEEIKAAFDATESPKATAPSPSDKTTETKEDTSKSSEGQDEEQGAEAEPEEKKTEKVKPASGEMRACPECSSNIPVELTECNVCGAEITSDALIQCAFCSKSLAADQEYCDHCGCDPHTGEAGPETQKCQECGVQLLPDTAVCLSCGTEQTKAINAKKASGTIPLVVLVVALLVFVGPAVFISMEQTEALKELQSQSKKSLEFHGVDAFQNVSPMSLPDKTLENDQADSKAKLIVKVMPLLKQEQWEEAKKLIEDKIEEADTLTISLLGLCYFKQDDVNNLIALEKARPDLPELHQLAIVARYREAKKRMIEGDSASAYATLKPVLQADSKDARLNFWGGLMAYKEFQLEEADQWFMKSSKLQPKEVLAHLLLYKIHKAEDVKRANREKAEFNKAKEKAVTFKELLN